MGEAEVTIKISRDTRNKLRAAKGVKGHNSYNQTIKYLLQSADDIPDLTVNAHR